jgi:hypothetical protein
MNLQGLIRGAQGVVDSIIYLLIMVAMLVFFWGVVKFIFRFDGSEKSVEEGKNRMVWGLVSLFVIMTIWGIISFIGGELEIRP